MSEAGDGEEGHDPGRRPCTNNDVTQECQPCFTSCDKPRQQETNSRATPYILDLLCRLRWSRAFWHRLWNFEASKAESKDRPYFLSSIYKWKMSDGEVPNPPVVESRQGSTVGDVWKERTVEDNLQAFFFFLHFSKERADCRQLFRVQIWEKKRN